MADLKHRRYVLIIDDGDVQKNLLTTPLVEQMQRKGIALTLVGARDGAQASMKVMNQKFDAVILDTAVPRMYESGFTNQIRTVKNTREGFLYVLSNDEPELLPEALKTGRVFPKPCDVGELIEALILDLSGSVSEKTAAIQRCAVDVRIVNAVISSTLKVLGQFQIKDITMGRPEVKDPASPLGGVISSVLNIVSKTFEGQLSISFDKGSYLELVTSMLCEEQTEINAENEDAAGEINNIIYGNAKPDLANFGVAMAIPKVLIGAGQCLEFPEGAVAMKVPFRTPKGSFFIEVLAHPIFGS
jgi:CheY-specific phosphatase CheX